GVFEVMCDMIIKFGKLCGKDIEEKIIKIIIFIFVVLLCWFVVYINLSIFGFIDFLSGFLVVVILCLLLMYVI
ncbi:hypothetical protein Q6306_25835, partial [Klebsiella pneumoniae]|nr:hypothetical protein [Klebsiella pneumoniae]